MTRIAAPLTAAQTEAADRVEERVTKLRSAAGYTPDMPAFGYPEAVALCHMWAVDIVTERSLKYAAMRGEMSSSVVLGKIRWSENDLMGWIVSMHRSANTSGGDAA